MTLIRIKSPFVVFLFLILFLSACGLGNAQVGRKPSPDWSRGIPLSSDVGGTIGMFVEGSGEIIHFVWPTALDDQAHVHYLQLDDQSVPVIDVNLNLTVGRQRTPRLIASGAERLHLFWANRVENSKGWVLWHTVMDQAGAIVGQPQPITPEDMNIGDYAVAQNSNGDAYIVWQDNKTGHLWGSYVDENGVSPDSVLLVENGDSPQLYVDPEGNLHMAWFDETRVKYAEFPGGVLETTEGLSLVQLEELTAVLEGPVVAVAGDWVYVIWSVFARSGMESGSGWTEYVSFPVGEEAPSVTERIWMLADEEQPYEPYSGAYPLTVQAPPVTNPAISSSYIVEPDAGTSRGSELAVAVSSQQEYRLEEYAQMATILFENGEYSGYQMAGKTESFSQDGSLFTDIDGNLHLAWLEGTGRRLYYASTSPTQKSNLEQLGASDMANALLGGGLEAVAGVLFFPLALIWFIPGAIILTIWKLKRDDETASDRKSVILIVVAVLTYIGTKILFLPTIMSYVPFTAWIDVPDSIKLLVQIMVPVILFVTGVIVAEVVRRRRPAISSVLYFFILCGVDAILTLAIYGVNYLGVI